MQYESLFIDHHKHSCMPPACQRAIRAVRQALRGEAVFPVDVALPKALDMVAQAFADLPPEIIARAAQEIRFIADLWSHQPYYDRTNQLEYFKWVDREVAKLDGFPKLAMLYLFHSDGRLRQAALHRIAPTMLSPFLFVALSARLNDWVRPVRQEAAACMARVVTAETRAKIAPAMPFLCLQTKTWARWADARAAYDQIEATPEVAAYMARHLRLSLRGPLPRQCYAMLRHAAFDAHLLDLAQSATTPKVRAIALGALLTQKASWITGSKKRWVDKSSGISSSDPIWSHRPINVSVDIAALVQLGAHSPAVAPRRVVAYWLLTTGALYPEAVAVLSQDPYPSIRNAMEFYQRKRAENA